MEDNCTTCRRDPADCVCFGPVMKWGGLQRVTFNAHRPERPIFETVSAFVFGDDGSHLHVQLPGDDTVRLIASSRVITIEKTA